MLSISSLSHQTLAVAPVVDYEPPPRAVGHQKPPLSVSRRVARPPHRPSDNRHPVAVSPALRTAATFADAALRRVLEVVDRRRSPAQLRPLLTAGLVDSVSKRPTAADATSAAVLRRVRLQVVGPDDPPAALEVFGTYTRGRRTHAVACRVEPVTGDHQSRWQVVALHIG